MDKVLEIQQIFERDTIAKSIADMWSRHSTDINPWIEEKKELRNYVFATDTTKTTNSKLPWKNKTTIPKICQIRDNLHANYMAAIFSGDEWMKWIGGNQESTTNKKKKAIQAYMENKINESGFYNTVSDLLYDYIDYGNPIADVIYVNEYKTDPETGEIIPGYIGPKLVRLSPLDVRFDPTASEFDNSPKITRYIKSLGELEDDILNVAEREHYQEVIDKAKEARRRFLAYDAGDTAKAEAFSVDGFGTFRDYLHSGYVEILEFEGSIYDVESGKFYKDYRITVLDRCFVMRMKPNPSWIGKSSKLHTGWRKRPDNLYAMGPLDNLVGMQYRIDHLENLKADAMDLAVHPPLVIQGEVEEFEYGPEAEIYVDEGGSVTELGKNLNGVIAANNEIAALEAKMEEMAGAPKQALGFRTPGEKTAYEVQTLENAQNRIFLLKARNFEINIIEKALNRMLEIARRNIKNAELVRVMDDDFGVADFLSITKEDITASGKLVATGARHFAATAQLIQNLQGGLQVAAQLPIVMNHVSGEKMAKLLFEESPGLAKFSLVQKNISVIEQAETQRLVNTARDTVATESITPVEAPNG